MTKFESQALQIIRIKYWNAGGSGNPPSLIPALWKIGIVLHKQATQTKYFDGGKWGGKCDILEILATQQCPKIWA